MRFFWGEDPQLAEARDGAQGADRALPSTGRLKGPVLVLSPAFGVDRGHFEHFPLVFGMFYTFFSF